MLHQIFYRIFFMSLGAGTLITLVFCLRPLTKNICSKTWHYYLWLCVICVLVIPFKFTLLSSAPVDNFLSIPTLAEPIMEVDTTFTTPVYPLSNGNDEPGIITQDTLQVSVSDVSVQPDIISAFPQVIPAIWLFGVILIIVYKAACYYRFSSFLRQTSSDFNAGNTSHDLLKYFLDFRKGYIKTPFLIGLFRPVVYLPDIDWDNTELEMALTHEMMHAQRKDLHYKALMQLVLCIHWFNPLVYIMNRDMQKYCELSCDERVVSRMDSEKRKAYMKTLLILMEKTRTIPENFAVAMGTPKSNMEGRIYAMLHNKNQKPFMKCISLFLMFIFFTGSVVVASEVNLLSSTDENRPSSQRSASSASSYSSPLTDQNWDWSWDWSNTDKNQWPVSDQLETELYDNALLVEKYYDNVTAISVEVSSENVNITRGGDKVKIKFYEWMKDEYTLTQKNQELQIKRTETASIQDGTSNMNDWASVVLAELGRSPNPEEPGVFVRTIDITIPESLTLETLGADTGSGKIRVQNIDANNALLYTGSGDIQLERSTFDGLSTDTGSGTVTIQDILSEEAILDSGSGNINAFGGTVNNLYIDTGSGRIEIASIKGSQAIADTGSGNISLIGCDFNNIAVDTSSGSVIVQDGRAEDIFADTSSGDVKILGISGLKSAKFDTSSGSMIVQLLDKIENYHIGIDSNINGALRVNGNTYQGNEASLHEGAANEIYLSSSTGTLTVEGQDNWTAIPNYKATATVAPASPAAPIAPATPSSGLVASYAESSDGSKIWIEKSLDSSSVKDINIKVNTYQVFLEKNSTNTFEAIFSYPKKANSDFYKDFPLDMSEDANGVLMISTRPVNLSGAVNIPGNTPRLVIKIPDRLYENVYLTLNACDMSNTGFEIKAAHMNITANASNVSIKPDYTYESLSIESNSANVLIELADLCKNTTIQNNTGRVGLTLAGEPENIKLSMNNSMAAYSLPASWRADVASRNNNMTKTVSYQKGSGSHVMSVSNNMGNVEISVKP